MDPRKRPLSRSRILVRHSFPSRYALPRILALFVLTAMLAAVGRSTARADEGLWTFDDFPVQQVADRYGFRPDQRWLDKVRLSSAKLAAGCSGSFVSGSGLLVTSHSCAQECVSGLSSAGRDYNHDGFYAKALGDEVRCPSGEIDVLLSIADVSIPIQTAERGLPDVAANAARVAATSRITEGCDKALRCEVVPLYGGGQFKLYTYKVYRDVRLVWAPEFDVAFFGGDPDDFVFPRFDLDATMLRAYENGRPASTPNYFQWNPAGPADGELTFVSGNPGSTERSFTMAQLTADRDAYLPTFERLTSDFDGFLTEYATESDDHRRQSLGDRFNAESELKRTDGELAALDDPAFFGARQKQEDAFRGAVADDPGRQARYGGAWDAIERAQRLGVERSIPGYFESEGFAQYSTLLRYAEILVRSAAERPKPDDQRLPEYADSRLLSLESQLFSTAPVAQEYERAKLTWYLTKLRRVLTDDDTVVRQVLGKQSPEEIATIIASSKLADPALRHSLWDGGATAIAASSDPAIVLMRALEPNAMAIRKFDDDEVRAPTRAGAETLARARFEIYGTGTYPDATSTLRLSYGAVKGYDQRGMHVGPFTKISGLYERATGSDPFALSGSWIAARSALIASVPLNFVATNESVKGFSGGPVIDRDARFVGVFFDGNLQSLGGAYGYDGTTSRAIAVDSSALTVAMRTVYHCDRILTELKIP